MQYSELFITMTDYLRTSGLGIPISSICHTTATNCILPMTASTNQMIPERIFRLQGFKHLSLSALSIYCISIMQS